PEALASRGLVVHIWPFRSCILPSYLPRRGCPPYGSRQPLYPFWLAGRAQSASPLRYELLSGAQSRCGAGGPETPLALHYLSVAGGFQSASSLRYLLLPRA